MISRGKAERRTGFDRMVFYTEAVPRITTIHYSVLTI